MQTVIVTGSAQGIGEALVERYLAAGARVIGLDILSPSHAENFYGYQCDVGDQHAVAESFAKIALTIDQVDVLVNNAGVWDDSALTHGNYESQCASFTGALQTGVLGSYFVTLAALPLLEAAEGAKIVNMLTEHIEPGHYITGMPATGYDCAKFSLWRLTETWAVELKKKSIQVNGLNFGATDTPMLRAVAPKVAEAGMHAADVALALDHVVSRTSMADTGRCYSFGFNGNSRAESLEEIGRLGEG